MQVPALDAASRQFLEQHLYTGAAASQPNQRDGAARLSSQARLRERKELIQAATQGPDWAPSDRGVHGGAGLAHSF